MYPRKLPEWNCKKLIRLQTCNHRTIKPHDRSQRMYFVKRNSANQGLLLPLWITYQNISWWYMISAWFITPYSKLNNQIFRTFYNKLLSTFVLKYLLLLRYWVNLQSGLTLHENITSKYYYLNNNSKYKSLH